MLAKITKIEPKSAFQYCTNIVAILANNIALISANNVGPILTKYCLPITGKKYWANKC